MVEVRGTIDGETRKNGESGGLLRADGPTGTGVSMESATRECGEERGSRQDLCSGNVAVISD